ncbi:hypothetical protein F5144DRAFT_11704 [Chaetomium tenue]|uniref:Uncharacterized protein n=1 Tax=Chaetomium tenue TaxID=1854479 RepID=A0ACB7PMS8_9PEZI|nr:hypothetical protein F5144DRAFT_11704 [Chaetomium globosum]
MQASFWLVAGLTQLPAAETIVSQIKVRSSVRTTQKPPPTKRKAADKTGQGRLPRCPTKQVITACTCRYIHTNQNTIPAPV